MLINILIILFLLLILYQIFLANKSYIIEGLENQTYQEYDTNNPNNVMILAQQNAGNIQVLKNQLDGLIGLNSEVQDISGNVSSLTEQVNELVTTQQQYAQNNLPSSPPEITGTI
jgi:hypothetical protein